MRTHITPRTAPAGIRSPGTSRRRAGAESPSARALLLAGTALLAAGAAVLSSPGALQSQVPLRGYVLGVGTRSDDGPLGPGGTTFVSRVRLMGAADLGPLGLEAAYEHVATRTPRGGGFPITGAVTPDSDDWAGLDWTLHETTRTRWRHRFDRLALSLNAGSMEISVGRQAISWGTTLFLTPADPFAPFDPSDPFREYRSGVDAARLRAFLSPFSEAEIVVRPADTRAGTTWTALARYQTSRGGWAVGGWAGLVHDEAGGALFATGAVGSTALRGEVSLRRREGGGRVVRGAVGLDRRFSLSERDLYLIGEVQYDGFGAASGSELLDVWTSKPFSRNEMQVSGRWAAMAQGSYQLHPLVSISGLVLADLADGSTLLSPGLAWSATASASVQAGLFVGTGDGGVGPMGIPRSEFGAVPALGYLSLSLFF
ncbi:MAG: hypothetical protein ACE5GJ_02920 [Gemmatimonadota bacterium]